MPRPKGSAELLEARRRQALRLLDDLFTQQGAGAKIRRSRHECQRDESKDQERPYQGTGQTAPESSLIRVRYGRRMMRCHLGVN